MNILFLSQHCCIRVVKEGYALMKAGHYVQFLQESIANPDLANVLGSCAFYSTESQLRARLTAAAMTRQFDIIHVHTEPDSLVIIARECCPDALIVYDAHDLDSQRIGVITSNEVQAMRATDAVVFPSQSYLNGACAVHPCLNAQKEYAVIRSYCSEDMFLKPEQQLPKLGGIVYEGGALACPDDAPQDMVDRVRYRDYRGLAAKFVEMDIPFTIMGIAEQHQAAYWASGAISIGSLPYMTMIKQLSRYDWGLVGCDPSHLQWQKAMPNKLFEYLAAGIPVIALNAGECGQFLEKYGLGVSAKDPDEIPGVYDRHEDLRANVLEHRHLFTMEKQLHLLFEDIYQPLLDRRQRAERANQQQGQR